MSLIRLSKLLNINKTKFTSNILPAINYSDDSKKSNETTVDESAKKKDDKGERERKKEELKRSAAERLHLLLDNMQEDSTLKIVKTVTPPKPGGYKKLRQKQKLDIVEEESEDITAAVKKVAEDVGGDAKQTESELLSKLKATSAKMTDINSLLSSMKSAQEDPEDDWAKKPSSNLRARREVRRPSIRQNDGSNIPRTDLFGAKPLDIFTNASEFKEQPELLQTWRKLQEQELKYLMTKQPRNYFEKMILWTEQGHIWNFPIDNEQGLDEEAQTSFTEHVFLEQHLDPWCPKKGPLRHFMHLICVGLSKNPYLSVKQKHEHIEWYKNYFEEKKDILSRVILQQDTPKVEEAKDTKDT